MDEFKDVIISLSYTSDNNAQYFETNFVIRIVCVA